MIADITHARGKCQSTSNTYVVVVFEAAGEVYIVGKVACEPIQKRIQWILYLRDKDKRHEYLGRFLL